MASLVGGVKNLVVEDREVEGESEADGVRGRKLGLGNLGSSLVGIERLVGRILAGVANGELGEVAVVVTLPVNVLAIVQAMVRQGRWYPSSAGGKKLNGEHAHLVVEHLGLSRRSGGNKVLVENLEDVIANLGEFRLDLDSVLLDETDLGAVALRLLLLLDRSDNPPRGTAGADDVLVGDGQEVALLDGEIAVFGCDHLHVLDHFCKSAHKALAGVPLASGGRFSPGKL